MSQSVFRIPRFDRDALELARRHQAHLTKPPGSLGRLEDLAVHVSAWQRSATPCVRPAAALLFAADHPVTRHGISPYPSAVTRAMLFNFLRGGAAASVLAKSHGIPLRVLDVGVDGGDTLGQVAEREHVVLERHAVASRTEGDIRIEDALSPDAFAAFVEAGRDGVRRLAGDVRVLLLGEMGIGNTTVAAAAAAALLRCKDPAELVGAGTGASGAILHRKQLVVRDAVARVGDEQEPFEILRRLGGRELAALLGAMLEGLTTGRLLLIDGFIVSAVALALCQRVPEARDGMVFAHLSDEQGHRLILDHLRVEPLLRLGLRLGEASGALTAFPLLELACALHCQMATFESAGVPDKESPE